MKVIMNKVINKYKVVINYKVITKVRGSSGGSPIWPWDLGFQNSRAKKVNHINI